MAQLSKQLVDERDAAAAQGELWKRQLKTLRERARSESEHARQLEEQLRASLDQQRESGGEGTTTPSARAAGGARSSISSDRQHTPATPLDGGRRNGGGGNVRADSAGSEGLTFGGAPGRGSSVSTAGSTAGSIRLSLPGSGGRNGVSHIRRGVEKMAEKMLDQDGSEELRKGVEKVGKAIGKGMGGLDTRVDRGLDRMEAIVGRLARNTGMAAGPSPNGHFAALSSSTPEVNEVRRSEVRNLMDE